MTSERRGWREHPLIQLTLVRYREFFREPEAVFWVFIFPVLLTAGLGIAFRNQAPERTRVELEHRNIDRHGMGWEFVRDGVGGQGGWPLYLERFSGLFGD